MNGLVAEYLARSIGKENIHNQGPIKVEVFHNPLADVGELVNKVVSLFAERLQQPAQVRVDCLEYAAEC